MLLKLEFNHPEAAIHEAGHFVIGAILGVPIGDIHMIGNDVRGGYVSTDKVLDWVREVGGDESEERFKCFVRVLVAGEQAMILHGVNPLRAEAGADKDLKEIRRLMNSSKDDETGQPPTPAQINDWIAEARTYVKNKLSEPLPTAALKALAAALQPGQTMPGATAHAIISPILHPTT